MHSSPIDLLVRAPGQPKTPPSESDSDERFSELLRQPSDAAAKPPAAGPKDLAAETAAAPEQDVPVAQNPIPADPTAGAVPAEQATIGESFLEAMAVVPEAITHAAVAAPAATTAVEAIVPAPQPSPTDPAVVNPSVPRLPAAGTPVGDPVSNLAPTAGLAVGQRPDPAGGQANIPAPSTQLGSVPEVVPVPKVAATPAPAANPALPAAQPNLAGVESVTTDPAVSLTDGEVNPASVTGSAVSPAAPKAAAAAAGVQSAQASVAATKVIAVPDRAVPAASEPQALPESAELTDGPDPATPATPAVTKTAARSGTAQTGLATSGAAAAQNSDRSAAVTAQLAARPDAAAVDLPASNAQPELPATASPQTARPVMEATALAQSTGNTTTPPPAAEQVILQLRRAVADGVDRLTVQLKPASLGRVDVQMEVGHDGRLQAVISAERPETLHLLQRDARTLTTALNDAGLQTDSGSLSFNLRGQTGDQAGGHDRLAPDGAAVANDVGAEDGDDSPAPITLTLGAGRVDIKV